VNDEMPNPFAVPLGEYSTDEDDALTSTVDAITELRQLADLVGFDLDAGLRQVEGERDTDMPRGPYTLEDLVMEVTAHAYMKCDQVREAFGVSQPARESQSKPQMPENGWPNPWGGDSPAAA
jgi:hypothetical protein